MVFELSRVFGVVLGSSGSVSDSSPSVRLTSSETINLTMKVLILTQGVNTLLIGEAFEECIKQQDKPTSLTLSETYEYYGLASTDCLSVLERVTRVPVLVF